MLSDTTFTLEGLTELKLAGRYIRGDLSPLRSLAIKKLTLEGCPQILSQLFAPGAFSGLQSLQIVEKKEYDARQPERQPEAYRNDLTAPRPQHGHARAQMPFFQGLLVNHQYGRERAQTLFQAGRMLLNHASLVEVSGRCDLFWPAMAVGLSGWNRTERLSGNSDETVPGYKWTKQLS